MIKRVALLGLILQVAPLSAQDIRDTFSSTRVNVTDELLSTLLNIKGQLKVTQIMELDNVLEDLEFVGQPRGFENYYLTIFGVPSSSNPWSWRFQGHHLSLNVTVVADEIAVTSSFLGATLSEISTGFMAGLRTLRAEEDLGRQLAHSLDAAQLKQAVIGEQAPRDLFTGNLDAHAFRLDG